jgi:hypothetical protein
MAEEKSPGHSFHIPDDGANGCFLRFDTLGKFELDERPGKIVFRVPGFKVHITFQIVGKISQSQLKSNEPDSIVQIVIIILGEERACY